MYEVAQVAGNKFEAACAIRNLKNIMGQISSNQSQHQQNRHYLKGNGKVYHRYSSPPAPRQFGDEDLLLVNNNKSEKLKEFFLSHHHSADKTPKRHIGNVEGGDLGFDKQPISSTPIHSTGQERPVTMNETNVYHMDLNLSSNKKNKKEVDSLNQSNNNNQQINGTTSNDEENKTATLPQNVSKASPRELFAVEGYHKTEHCYYKRPDGGYIKLPPDSFHKTSEGCYTKLMDGTFVRVESSYNKICGSNQSTQNQTQASESTQGSRQKSNVLRFLKRSKSHTPSTMKEMQKEKEREREKLHNQIVERNMSAQGAQNRRVMVTMIDGGLPVLATSKADKVHKPKVHLQKHQQGGAGGAKDLKQRGDGKAKDIRNKVISSLLCQSTDNGLFSQFIFAFRGVVPDQLGFVNL